MVQTVGKTSSGPVMNPDRLQKLQAQVRIGGKGTPRRKKKVVHTTTATDDKKLQSCLKKLSVNTIPGIEEVNMMKDDGTVIHFNNPKAQASLAANSFAITGHGETKPVTELLPGILNQLGPDGLNHLKRFAMPGGFSSMIQPSTFLQSSRLNAGDDDEVPELTGDFDEASREEDAHERDDDVE